jgi:hypothetical protein
MIIIFIIDKGKRTRLAHSGNALDCHAKGPWFDAHKKKIVLVFRLQIFQRVPIWYSRVDPAQKWEVLGIVFCSRFDARHTTGSACYDTDHTSLMYVAVSLLRILKK